MKKNLTLTTDATELLKDLDDAFLDFTLDEFANWEEAFDLIDRARSVLYAYLKETIRCKKKKKKATPAPQRKPSTTSSSKHTTSRTQSSKPKK